MYEHFKEYFDVLQRIKELKMKLEAIKHNIYDIKGVKYDGMPKVTAPSDALIVMIAEKDEIEKELKGEVEKASSMRKVFLEEIAKVEDVRLRSILRCYYVDRMSKEEIARAEKITIGHFYKLKREAVKAFKAANGLMTQNDTK